MTEIFRTSYQISYLEPTLGFEGLKDLFFSVSLLIIFLKGLNKNTILLDGMNRFNNLENLIPEELANINGFIFLNKMTFWVEISNALGKMCIREYLNKRNLFIIVFIAMSNCMVIVAFFYGVIMVKNKWEDFYRFDGLFSFLNLFVAHRILQFTHLCIAFLASLYYGCNWF